MNRSGRVRTFGLILALLASPAAAHVTTTGLAQVTADANAVTYRLTLVLSELPADPAQLLARATRGERADAERIADALRTHVTIRIDGETCRPGRIIIRGVDLGEPKALLEYGLHCPATPGRLDLEESWTDFLGPHYRTIVTIATPRGRIRARRGNAAHVRRFRRAGAQRAFRLRAPQGDAHTWPGPTDGN